MKLQNPDTMPVQEALNEELAGQRLREAWQVVLKARHFRNETKRLEAVRLWEDLKREIRRYRHGERFLRSWISQNAKETSR